MCKFAKYCKYANEISVLVKTEFAYLHITAFANSVLLIIQLQLAQIHAKA